MPIPFKPQNIIVFASTLSPIFITFYFILEGAFNGHVKFIIWLIGLFIAIISGILLRSSGGFSGNPDDMASQASDIDNYVKKCITFDGPFNGSYDKLEGPSSHAIFHGFTILYILLSVFDNPNDVGWGFVITLIIIASIDLAVRKKNNCNTVTDTIKGGALGVFFGIIWWQIIKNSKFPGEQYLYYGKEETMKKCKLSKTRFRCRKTK